MTLFDSSARRINPLFPPRGGSPFFFFEISLRINKLSIFSFFLPVFVVISPFSMYSEWDHESLPSLESHPPFPVAFFSFFSSFFLTQATFPFPETFSTFFRREVPFSIPHHEVKKESFPSLQCFLIRCFLKYGFPFSPFPSYISGSFLPSAYHNVGFSFFSHLGDTSLFFFIGGAPPSIAFFSAVWGSILLFFVPTAFLRFLFYSAGLVFSNVFLFIFLGVVNSF